MPWPSASGGNVSMLLTLHASSRYSEDYRALTDTLQLACTYRLSAHDATYLELAMRAGLELATLDNALMAAAKAAGVSVFV